MRIHIHQAHILTMEREGGQLKPPFRGDILVEGEKIAYVGEGPAPVEGVGVERIEGQHLLAMPGLVNAHTHAAMSLFRGFGDDMGLMAWLRDKIWPAEAKMKPADILWGTRLSLLEMLKSGTTTFADMYYFCEEVLAAVEEAGCRACICQGAADLGAGGEEVKLSRALAFALRNRGACGGRISTLLGVHAPYTCSAALLRQAGAWGRAHQLPLHIHLAETREEEARIEARDGCRPVALLERVGFFEGNQVLAAHGIWLNAEDMHCLGRHGVSVAHCPSSNCKLASGIAPVVELMEAGVNIALGTDSACSNNRLDLFGEVKLAALLAKARALNPQALPASAALEMATVGGAKALGLKACGVLAVGKQADIILLNMEQPHLRPRHNLISHLAYAAGGADIDTVMVAGKLLMHKREMKTLDEERIFHEAERRARALCLTGFN